MLFDLFQQQLKALFTNRQQRINRQREMSQEFRNSNFVIDQTSMQFIP